MERNGDILVLQGVENSRGRDLAINVKTGNTSKATGRGRWHDDIVVSALSNGL
jgi:hypothetical protein